MATLVAAKSFLRVAPLRRVRPAVCAAVIAVLAGGTTIGACTSSHSPRPLVIMVTAAPDTTHDQLLELAGALVGGHGNLADPNTGRLPNLDAFRAAGIGTLTVSGAAIRIVLRDDATTGQEQAVLSRLRASPIAASITTSR